MCWNKKVVFLQTSLCWNRRVMFLQNSTTSQIGVRNSWMVVWKVFSPVRMRSMEGTGGSGHPGGLAGGRPSRVSSPRYNGYDRSQRHRQRPRQTGDTSMDEIIQFVRGYQMERQPTLLRLQKKAPLPGIGQVSYHPRNCLFSSYWRSKPRVSKDSHSVILERECFLWKTVY